VYQHGWRGSVFIVDDNFIGNKNKVKRMLPEVVQWNREKDFPFTFVTEASLNLADDERLMELMVEAGFDTVFVGLETPSMESLVECNKSRNKNRNMEAAVKKIQNYGMQVFGGFIVGFDSDPPSIFDNQIDFIQRLGVVTAMVGTLTALPKTKLYNRLDAEGRLLRASSGNNTDGSLNFVPKMNPEVITNGYQRIVQTIYSPKRYYERILTFLEEYKPMRRKQRITLVDVKSFLKTVWYIGIVGKWRRYYWKLVVKALFKNRRAFPEVITLAAYGFHFRKVTQNLYNDSGSA
ncbi:MAG: B12-binding domain-containing radical SAM protein, partial [Dehalococcoidia bacterium]